MAIKDAAAVVTGRDGRVQSLGQFLRSRKQACGLPVTRIVEVAGISRANFYLLEKDSQRPSLSTLVSLFGAMGLETRLPAAEDPSQPADLVILVGEEAYKVDLRWTAEERSRSRARYVSAATSGLGAAIDALDALVPTLGRLAGARLVGGTGGSPGGAGTFAAAAPIVVPALGSALAVVARRLRERRDADRGEAAAAPSQEDVLEDLKETAASMSTEELEALLAAMKAMRENQIDEA